MTQIVVSVRDVKAGEYFGLVVVGQVVHAQRHFLTMIETPDGKMSRFPRDYQLHRMGEFDPIKGTLTCLEGRQIDITPYDELEESIRLMEQRKAGYDQLSSAVNNLQIEVERLKKGSDRWK